MNKGILIGLLLVIVGVIIYALYALWLGAEELMQLLSPATVIIGGLIFFGCLIILISAIIDRYHETEEIKQKIKKEDLEP